MTTKKADYIWFNGEMVRWEDAKVHVMSHALHYGTSVFEGIRCYDSHKGPVVFRHREHMQRLHDSAKIYRFPVSQSIDELMEACRDVIRKNNLTSAYIRPLIFVGDVGMGVNPPAGYSTDVIIAALPGITRDAIIKLAKELGIEVREQVLSRESLYLADEVFMSGTAAEITPVRSVDGIQVGEGRCGPVTKRIQQAFFGLFTGETEDKWGWLDQVNQ